MATLARQLPCTSKKTLADARRDDLKAKLDAFHAQKSHAK
jgi:hypothetical protein